MTVSTRRHVFASVLCGLVALPAAPRAQDLPVDRAALEALGEKAGGRSGLTNLLSLAQVAGAVRDGASSGLSVDFAHVSRLLDGSVVAPEKIYGRVYAGPHRFEAAETRFPYSRFRLDAEIKLGKALIDVGSLLKAPLNSEGWKDRGRLAVRFALFLEQPDRDRPLGVYDTTVDFQRHGGGFTRLASLLEGPFVNLVRSDAPHEAVISFVTDTELRGRVVLERSGDPGKGVSFWEEMPARRHEIRVDGLVPGTEYRYRVEAGGTASGPHRLQAAPPKGAAPVTFAYLGDTRAGPGGGLQGFMGVNRDTLTRLSHVASTCGAAFLLLGGDLVSGYTSVPDDFEAQLHAWTEAAAGFWVERPLYAAMGNHEALQRIFESASADRWPYPTESAEAVFARTFVHPLNGPKPADHRRPQYAENVYSLQYGCVLAIAFNNNYWYSSAPEKYGGSPEGYILGDQLDWIAAETSRAEADPTVRYVLLFAQEPIFPNGGHLNDSTWHGGDNRVRACRFDDGKIVCEEDGMIVMRNRLVRLAASHRKVAAILGADEHAYHRVLIHREVPLGDIERDDRNRNARIDVNGGEVASPLPDLRYGVWYVVCGGGGAPYYSEETTPWNAFWAEKRTPRSGLPGFYYSSQENVLLFEASESALALRVLNLHGELIEEIPDLMADKE